MHPKYRADIDGLRAVAVASVVIFHAFPTLVPGGFIGVDIFFVISGFLITTIILQSHAAGDFSYRDFYARRIRRIFPALMLVLAATLAFGWYVLLSREFAELGKQVVGGASFVANFVFWGEAGYFDTASEAKPLLHLWSLGIEEQFYIFWPLLLGIAWRRRWPIVRVLWALAAVSFLVNVLTIHPFRTAAFYSPVSRFWELMAGAILAGMRLAPATTASKPWRSHVQSVLGVGLIALGLVAIRSDKAFPGWWALLPVFGAASCIAAGPAGVLNKYILSNRAMVWLGLISYPLYLWHWPLLAFARIVEGAEPPLGVRAAMVVASVALAWLTYRYVERFVRERSGAGTLRVLWQSGVVVIMAGLVVLAGAPARNNSELLQKVVDAESDRGYYDGLRLGDLDGFPVRRFGDGARKVLLIGDSHVMQYAPRAAELARSSPDRMATADFATFFACPPIPGVFAQGIPDCGEGREKVLQLALDPKFDAVVIGGCWNCYFTGNLPVTYEFRADGAAYPLNNGGPGISRSLDSLETVLKGLAGSGKKVYLLLDNPTGPQFAPKSLIEGSRLGKPTVTDVRTGKMPPDQASLDAQLRRIAASSGVEIIDASSHLCQNGQCLRAMPDNTPVYADDQHLRAAYTRHFANYLDPIFLGTDKEATPR
ncbi:acyltransferase family protein [Variovorax sp. PAMC26660]|uniref:acyltransferase family protein n=1 Tax=Variovorax sp. PAMC26660 TaxID=2762322 RepID=UPI00164DDB7D|nr:acyltransferase family protein [Variovorax sp. PAMC26660]QNK69102.1 acyltransferase [Variovorax sp. PAMC26660]